MSRALDINNTRCFTKEANKLSHHQHQATKVDVSHGYRAKIPKNNDIYCILMQMTYLIMTYILLTVHDLRIKSEEREKQRIIHYGSRVLLSNLPVSHQWAATGVFFLVGGQGQAAVIPHFQMQMNYN